MSTPAAKEPEDFTQRSDYQAFVQSMVVHCRCRSGDRPCAGVLAGGLCDDIQDDRDRDDSSAARKARRTSYEHNTANRRQLFLRDD